MSDGPAMETVVELLTDETVQTILRETSLEPRSAGELTGQCDASQQTVYRRLEQLEAARLVDNRTRVREDGHHDTVYEATLDTVSIRLRDGDLQFDVGRREPEPADRLTDMWRNF